MTFQTRTIAKRTGTYMDAGDNGVHVNRVTLRAEPWDKPELKPEHQRREPDKMEAVFSAKSGGHVWDVIRTVRTPTIAKVRVLRPDRFAQWDQDVLADEWKALCRQEGHIALMPASVNKQKEGAKKGAAKRLPQSSRVMVDLLERLRHGDIRYGELFDWRRPGNLAVQRRRAFEMGWIKGGRQPESLISLTADGYRALAAMKAAAQ